MPLVQIPGTDLYRDTDNMALVNKDKNGLTDYLNKRRIFESQKQEIDNIKDDIKDIKEMLYKLMEKNNG
jgi:hypothetical protein